MDTMKTEGKTVFKVCPKDGYGHEDERCYAISILSRRALKFVLKQSLRGKYRHNAAEVWPPFVYDGFEIVGFQADTGLHLACKAR